MTLFLRSLCLDAQGVDVRMQQRRERLIHELMALQARATGELLGYHKDGKMAAFTSTGMAGVRGAVVTDLKPHGGEARGQRLTDFLHPLRSRHVVASRGRCRDSHASCRPANTTVAAVRPNNLKFTHVRSLALKATSRFTPPKSA